MTRRAILGAALVWFLIYAYPGYIGWDTEAHLMQSRAGVYSDAHPPVLPALWRVCEVFVHGPLLMMLIQALSLLVGLDRCSAGCSRRDRPRSRPPAYSCSRRSRASPRS